MARAHRFKVGDYVRIPERHHTGYPPEHVDRVASAKRRFVILEGEWAGPRHRPLTYWRHVDLEPATEADYLYYRCMQELQA